MGAGTALRTTLPPSDYKRAHSQSTAEPDKLRVSPASTASGCCESVGSSLSACIPGPLINAPFNTGGLPGGSRLTAQKPAMSLAAASTTVARHVCQGAAREYPGGTPTPDRREPRVT